MRKRTLLGGLALLPLLLAIGLFSRAQEPHDAESALPFADDFSDLGRIVEAPNPQSSSSPSWWLNSGAYFLRWNGFGSTVQNELKESDRWRSLYAYSDPGETDGGARPQNIFRLLTKARWDDVVQETSVRINRYHLSSDMHRGESNGVLLFGRYQNDNNLYYGGLRVDGSATIKKKQSGTYYTLALEKILPGEYDRAEQPNLLPVGNWIGLRLETRNLDHGQVAIRLYTDLHRTGSWTLAAEAIDDGTHGGSAITEPGSGGIRTDFMDVDLDRYRADTIAESRT